MKSRYNCAYPDDDVDVDNDNDSLPRPKATDYKLVLKSTTSRTTTSNTTMDQDEYCDLQLFVQEAGGPSGIAKRSTLRNNGNRNSNKERPLHVLLQGSSYLRQIFQALVCGFQSQITDFLVQVGGPDLSLAGYRARGNQTITVEQLGDFIGLAEAKHGCHAPSGTGPMSQFYRQNVTVPPIGVPGCGDNIAMVEFNHSIRFYYVFWSDFFRNTTIAHVYKNTFGLGNVEEDLDVLVWNRGGVTVPGTTPHAKFLKFKFSDNPKVLKQMNLRDTGQYFGADNPWLSRVPDNHPCMPGIPDDEVNLLLLLLSGTLGTNISVVAT